MSISPLSSNHLQELKSYITAIYKPVANSFDDWVCGVYWLRIRGNIYTPRYLAKWFGLSLELAERSASDLHDMLEQAESSDPLFMEGLFLAYHSNLPWRLKFSPNVIRFSSKVVYSSFCDAILGTYTFNWEYIPRRHSY